MDRRQFVASAGAAAMMPAAGCAPGSMQDYTQATQAIRTLPRTLPVPSELVRIASLAPNGHNTQPWLFEVGYPRISIRPDLSRRTAVVDPDDHHIYVSLGCAAETLAITGGAFGAPANVSFDAAGDGRLEVNYTSGVEQNTDLYPAIALRQSTRAPFTGQLATSDILRQLEDAARLPGVSLAIYTSEGDKQQIMDFVIEGNTAQLANRDFVAELRDWIRFNPREALSTGDGLYSACSGNPEMPTWIGRNLLAMFLSADAENDKYREQIKSSAGVAVFTADREGPEGWAQVGRSFQRFALQLTALGLLHSHINQPVEDIDVRSSFAAWLGAPQQRPDLVVRFGYGTALPYSMRRPVAEVVAT